ncbi:MAG: exo-alpha-sialidase [Chloroflexi bacterium]|nr:exo-alpha-sialidase [Chloroflexota bacterium]
MEHRVIFKDPAHYASFPRVRRMRNGELLLAYYDQSDEVRAQHPNIHPHYQFGSHVVVQRSRDEGQSWQRSLVDEWPAEWRQSDIIHLQPGEPYREPDAPDWQSAAELEDGTIIHSAGSLLWHRDPERLRLPPEIADPPVATPDGWYRTYIHGLVARCRFVDGRWHKELSSLKVPPYTWPHWGWCAPRRMPDGSLVAIMLGKHPEYPERQPGTIFAARSTDNGMTWAAQGIISPHNFQGTAPQSGDPAVQGSAALPYTWSLCDEVTMALTPGGKLVSVHRTEGEPDTLWPLVWHVEGFVHQADSLDLGQTWQPAHKTPMWGHPAHLLLLDNGLLVCVFGYRRAPFGIHACISYDEGQTWDYENVRILRSDGAVRDLGYPNSVQLKDGRIYTTYYFTKSDGIRHIAATVWSV